MSRRRPRLDRPCSRASTPPVTAATRLITGMPLPYCAGGTSGAPVPADGIVCVSADWSKPSTAGRYLLSRGGEIDVRQVGMKPGGFDNYPLVQTLMNAVSAPTNNNGNHTPAIMVPPIFGQSVTTYYFSKPFTLARSSIVDCKTSNITGFGGVGLFSLPVWMASGRKAATCRQITGGGEGDIRGCSIMSFGYAQGKVTPGTGNVFGIGFQGRH